MGIEIETDIKNFGNDFVKSTTDAMHDANRQASDLMRHKIKQSYENRGFLDPSSKREGAIEWEPTTIIARKKRKSYPKGSAGQKKGKKGLTQQQSRYLFTSPTLVDTGAQKDSVTEEEELFSPMELNIYTGASKPSIETSEEGGQIDGHEVPARPSQYITEKEFSLMEKIFIRAFNNA